jgi:hypothetical protein
MKSKKEGEKEKEHKWLKKKNILTDCNRLNNSKKLLKNALEHNLLHNNLILFRFNNYKGSGQQISLELSNRFANKSMQVQGCGF